MVKCCISLFFSFLFVVVKGQNLAGIVTDDSGDPMPQATVMLLNAEDSVLNSFALTTKEGRFRITNISSGDYLVRINFVGFQVFDQFIKVEKSDLNLDTLQLMVKELDEVIIEEEADAVVMKHDTIEFNASSFKTRDNAMVEDLLKKLPGVEIDREGNIKAQGKDVSEILVDGKPFFDGDKKMATKNLPAVSIDKVQVFDKKSRFAQIAGGNEDSESKSINLKLKKDYRKGAFGQTRAGYGSDNRFDMAVNRNRFGSVNQISIIGNFNNINNNGENFNPQANNGFQTTVNGGVNLGRTFKKLRLSSSYNIKDTQSDMTVQSDRTNFLNEDSYDSKTSEFNDSKNTSHNASLRLDYNIDETQRLDIQTKVNYGTNESRNHSESQNLENGELISANVRENETSNETLNVSSTVNYNKRFNEKGRVLTLSSSYQMSEVDSERDISTILNSIGGQELNDQEQLGKNTNYSLNANLAYSEPIGKNESLTLKYRRKTNNGDNEVEFYDIDGESFRFNDELSSVFERKYDYSSLGLSFNTRSKKMNFNSGINYQFSVLEGKISDIDQRIENKFNRFLPFANSYFTLNDYSRVNINYTTRLIEPSLEQLQPVTNNTDPLNISEGDPNLNAEYVHGIRLGYNVFDQFSQTTLFASVNANFTQDNIVTNRSIDSVTFVQTTRPVNANDSYDFNANTSFSRPIKIPLTEHKLKFNLNHRWSLTEQFTMVNEVLSETKSVNNSFTFGIENSKKENVDLSTGLTYTTGKTRGESSSFNQSFNNQTLFLDAELYMFKRWSVNSKFDYMNYGSASFSGSQAVRLWQASVNRTMFKNKKGELKLSVFDILNENKGITRTTNTNYIEERRTSTIGRYFMLTFSYRLSTFGRGMMRG